MKTKDNNTKQLVEPNDTLTKVQLVTKLLSRKAVATLAKLTQATGWQPLNARAYLNDFQKNGAVIICNKRKGSGS